MTADYKRGVEDGTAAFGSEHVFPGTYWRVHTPGCELWGAPLGVRIEQLLKERRKKLLTKKVTKWTGIITSEWSGLPTILELCDTEEEVKKFLAKNPKPLTKAIPIEIETEI